MLIYIAADHRGFKLKEILKTYIKSVGYEVYDLGNNHYDENDDYPIFAKLVSEKIQADPAGARGVLICGSGVGVDIVANKFDRVRSVLAISTDGAVASKIDDDTNILSIAADFMDEEIAKKTLAAWLATNFVDIPKHKRRLEEIKEIEEARRKEE